METSKMESTDIRQVEEMLQTQLKNFAEESDRIRLIALVEDYFSLLERTQSLPILQRLIFFDCTYIVFNFLRLNRQLMRHVEQFDKVCIDDFKLMIRRLYDRL
jgi:hypothetical protein